MRLGNLFRFSRAIIAIGFAIAAADGAIFACAKRAHFNTCASDIGAVTVAGRRVAPQTFLARNPANAAAHLANLRS